MRAKPCVHLSGRETVWAARQHHIEQSRPARRGPAHEDSHGHIGNYRERPPDRQCVPSGVLECEPHARVTVAGAYYASRGSCGEPDDVLEEEAHYQTLRGIDDEPGGPLPLGCVSAKLLFQVTR
jgi:hypothetical protein